MRASDIPFSMDAHKALAALRGAIRRFPLLACGLPVLVAAICAAVAFSNHGTSPAGHAAGRRHAATLEPAATGIAALPVDMRAGAAIGTALRGRAPEAVPLPEAEQLAERTPAGAVVNRAVHTITFSGHNVTLTLVASPPTGGDMRFRAGGMSNPTIVVPVGARVTLRLINADSDSAHGWLLIDPRARARSVPHGPRAFPGSFAPMLGDPTASGQAAETVSFTASRRGTYIYMCPVPGHARMGMRGSFRVV